MEVKLTTTSLPEHLQEFARYDYDPICTKGRKADLNESIQGHNNELKETARSLGCNWVVGITYGSTPETNSQYGRTIATGTPVFVDY